MMQPDRAEAQPRVPRNRDLGTLAPPVGTVGPLRLGPELLEHNLILAPMAGVTNLPFRLIARESGAALVFTETVSAKGLVQGGHRTWELLESSPVEQPLAYQLFGSDPAVLGEATRMLVDRGARFVDLNLGCPVKKFIRNGAGSALLRQPARVGEIVRAMRRAHPDGPLSVKVRLGWDAGEITAPEVVRVAEAEGVDFATVHGRTRAQQYRGRADRGRMREVVEAVRMPVFANGDVTQARDALDLLRDTGAAGVMIGRGALTNPWVFAQTLELSRGHKVPEPSPEERARLVDRHLEIMLDYFKDPRFAVHMIKKYLCAYSTGIVGGSEFRQRVNLARDLEPLLGDAARFFRAMP
jgi:tRNA-dihydrouridine synthase B